MTTFKRKPRKHRQVQDYILNEWKNLAEIHIKNEHSNMCVNPRALWDVVHELQQLRTSRKSGGTRQ